MSNRRHRAIVRKSAISVVEKLEPRALMSVAEPTAAEQYMLELVNRARANPALEASNDGISLNEGLASGTISNDTKQPLAFNPQLITAARSHNQWMIQQNTFSHDEGSVDPGAQIRAAGYPFAGSWTWGQNIAWVGQQPSAPALDPTVEQEEKNYFIDAGTPDRGHRLNLLNDSFKEIGIGALAGSFQGYNSVLTTQDFAAESGNSFLTGVAFTDAAGTRFYAPGKGLGNITITATRASDHAVFSTTTWSAGGYTLALAPGAYAVNATGAGLGTMSGGNVVIGARNVQVDFAGAVGPITSVVTPTVPTTVPVTPNPIEPQPVTTDPVSVSTSGEPQSGSVSGTVFRDRNGDAAREPGDTPLAKWRVYADLNNDGRDEAGEPSTLTNARGQYHITLTIGAYTIRQVSRRGFTQIANGGKPFSVNISRGVSLTDVSFANQPLTARQLAAQLRLLHRSI